MTQRIYIDRSRIVTRERCPRRRWLEYSEAGTGIQPARTPLALAVGTAVHAGLAQLLRRAQMATDEYGLRWFDERLPNWSLPCLEQEAVDAALADFSEHSQKIEVETAELAAMQPTAAAAEFQQQAIAQAAELGMNPEDIAGLARDPAVARSEFDRYLFAEQSALVEAMVRAYARRRLRPLLEQFEVLEVEREGTWQLSEFDLDVCPQCNYYNVGKVHKCVQCGTTLHYELWFMSRPDALLRERATNELYLLSYKTTAQWDQRKARDIEHDMQGLSEGVEVERRLGEWWQQIQEIKRHAEQTRRLEDKGVDVVNPDVVSPQIYNYLCALPAPPRIHAIRYEFLLKGYRSEDRELSARLGVTAYTQRSHLVRQYVAVSTPKSGKNQEAFRVGDVCWSFEYVRPEDQQSSKLYAGNWQSRQVEDVRGWIDKLDQSETLISGEDSTIGLEPRALGYRSDAQAMGVTKDHPLDSVFIPPITVWRSDDDLRDWVESVEHQERTAAEGVALVNASTDPGERRSLMNIHFPMVRSACEYPSSCAFVKVCYAGAEMKNDPLAVGGGMFVRRVPNHPVESQSGTQLIDKNK